MPVQPMAYGEGLHEGLVQDPGLAVVDVFYTGTLAKFGLFEARLQAPGVSFGFLAVEQQGEAFCRSRVGCNGWIRAVRDRHRTSRSAAGVAVCRGLDWLTGRTLFWIGQAGSPPVWVGDW